MPSSSSSGLVFYRGAAMVRPQKLRAEIAIWPENAAFCVAWLLLLGLTNVTRVVRISRAEDRDVETVEERVAYVTGRVVEHGRMVDGIREAVVHLEARMDRRFEAVDRRFEALDQRLTALDQKVDLRIDAVDQRMSRQFMWMVGLQITTLVAIVTTLVATVTTLAAR